MVIARENLNKWLLLGYRGSSLRVILKDEAEVIRGIVDDNQHDNTTLIVYKDNSSLFIQGAGITITD
jgi:hypothetical protein